MKNKSKIRLLISIIGIIGISVLIFSLSLNATEFENGSKVYLKANRTEVKKDAYNYKSWTLANLGEEMEDKEVWCINDGTSAAYWYYTIEDLTSMSSYSLRKELMLQYATSYGGTIKFKGDNLSGAKQYACWSVWSQNEVYAYEWSHQYMENAKKIWDGAVNYANKIITQYNGDFHNAKPTITTTAATATSLGDGKYKVGPFSVKYDEDLHDINSITIYSGENAAINAIRYEDESGKSISGLPKSETNFYIVINGENTIKKIDVKYTYKYCTSIRVRAALAYTNYQTQAFVEEKERESGVVEAPLNITIGAKWSLILYKTDMDNKEETTKGIAGATFKVKYKSKDGETTKKYTTAENNGYTDSIIWGSIEPGETQTLEVTEITAPAGYVKLDGTVIVTIKCDANLNVTMEAKCSELTYSYNNTDTGEYRFNTRSDNRAYLKFFDRREGKYNIQIVKVDEDTGKRLSGAKFTLNGTAMSETNSNGISTSGNMTIKGTGTDTLTIVETAQPTDYQPIGTIQLQVTKGLANNKYAATAVKITQNPNNCTAEISGNTIVLKVPNKRVIKNGEYKIRIVKQDSVNGAKLSGAKFSINGKTLSGATDANGILVSDRIIVNSEGTDSITISEITAPVNYEAIGTIKLNVTKKIVNYKFSATGVTITQNQNNSVAKIEGDTIIITIPNKRKTIKLGGYVWEDEKQGKESTLNGKKDDNEKPLKGIKVYLHVSGKAVYSEDVWETSTNSNGRYEFEVPMGANYYVEFKYNGYNYQHTKYTKYTGAASPITSNATETESARDSFNNRLAEIGPNTTINNVKVSNKDNTLKATDLGTNEIYAISAYVGGYGEKNTTKFSETADNINLGITKRENTDIALRKDVYTSTISIKGKKQTYTYNRNNKETDSNGNSYWDIAVRRSDSEYYSNYSRPVQESDYNYMGNNKLDVEVTYKIVVRNQSGVINTKITELVDFYDKDYTLKGVKTASGESLNVTSASKYSHNITIADYQKAYIQLNKELLPGEDLTIYTTFGVRTDDLGKIKLDTDSGKGNMVEIMGYSTYYGSKVKSPNDGNTEDTYTEYKEGEVVGRIDVDSNPGNAESMDEKTFEDDTDRAPYISFKLDENKRTTSGIVWEDARTNEVEKAMVGNGIREEGESGVSGVKVQLMDLDTGSIAQIWNNGWKNAEVKTGEDGKYSIEGFLPGNYYVQFIYPDGQKYKSTTFNYAEVCPDFNIANPDNLGTYKETTTNYSDARDIYGSTTMEKSRMYVNSLLQEQTSKTLTEYEGKDKSMKAVTGEFEVTIEKGGNNIQGLSGNEIQEYKIENIDLGLQERPKAQLMLTKKVKNVQVILANGNTLFDASGKATNVLWRNKIEHDHSYTDNKMNIPVVRANTQTIQLTIDEELIHGATIKIRYGIEVKNIGEVDYSSKRFYYLGKKENSETPIKTIVEKILDYPGAAGGNGSADANSTRGNLQYNAAENTGWEVVTADNIKEAGLVTFTTDGNNVTNSVLNKYKTILMHVYSAEEGTLLPEIYTEDESKTKTPEVELTTSQVMTTQSNTDELQYVNIAEIVQIRNGVARTMAYSTPGNQNPDKEIEEVDADAAQAVTILPPFGNTYIYYGLTLMIATMAIGGIVLIKIKVLKNKQ